MSEEPTPKNRWTMTKGGKNLTILGIVSIIITIITCSISLAIYHNSGDIYLDRSRPGYLPEEGSEEGKDPVPEEYDFDKTGKLTISDIEEYLENLDIDIKALDSYKNPFSPDVLSDKNFGIVEK